MVLESRGLGTEVMSRDSCIYVAGHGGLVGSAIVRELRRQGFMRLVLRTSAEVDLRHRYAVRELLRKEKPEYVFVAAAKVGGILANSTMPASFIHDNMAIALNLVDESYRAGVKRLLFLGSSCIYPKLAPQPLKEEYLLTGPLEPTNRPYAIAKISAIEMCWAYNRQYGTKYFAVMPTNVYGPGDNYHPEHSHVLPAMIRRMHEAKVSGAESVTLWGTGTARREFIYSDDLASACVYLMDRPEDCISRLFSGVDICPIVNVGWGEDLTIAELAKTVAEVVGFRGVLLYDHTKPDGTPRKLLDVSRLVSLGWRSTTGLREGIAAAYMDFQSRDFGSHDVAGRL